jgi:rare lipoprotein A (peptidoglycan hydrolase)
LVLLPLVSLHHKHRDGGLTPQLAAASSSLRLIADSPVARASRSAPRTEAVVGEVALGPPAPTTTVKAAPTVRASTVKRSSASSPTTAKKRRTTTTTSKPKAKKSTTTTTKPKSKSTSAPREMRPATAPAAGESTGQTESGEATWYEAPDPNMCAHKTIPLGTVVTVTDVASGKSTTCRVGDRGPYAEGKIIDLSAETFSRLAPLSAGVVNVRVDW